MAREFGADPRSLIIPEQHLPAAAPPGVDLPPPPDMAEILGQAEARFALEIAAAGGHHLMLTGPPGAGKTMLAERLPGLLPDLGDPARMETPPPCIR